MKANSYSYEEGISRANYVFSTSNVEDFKDDTISRSLIDSFDVEAVRHKEDEQMPDPNNPDDVTASIAHAVQPSDQSKDPFFIVFSWGKYTPKIPLKDRTGRDLPKLDIVVKNYETETKMLINWAHWWLNYCDSDVIIGWNILGFDLYV